MYYNQQPNYRGLGQYRHKELKKKVLNAVSSINQYRLQESWNKGDPHGVVEVAAISYLMGMGYTPIAAKQMVELWEMNDSSYRYGC